MRIGLPVVSCPYMPAAEIPMPCWPRLMRKRWNLEPYSSLAKMRGICSRTIPGPLSAIVIRKRVACDGAGKGSPLTGATSILTMMSGRIPASSQASSELSTASLTQVRSALRGLSNPSRCRFLVKNSETEISRWRAPISTAVRVAGLGFGRGEGAFGFFFMLSHLQYLKISWQALYQGSQETGKVGRRSLEAGDLVVVLNFGISFHHIHLITH